AQIAAAMDGPTMPCNPTRAEKTVATGFVSAISDSFSNDSLVLVRFQSTTPNAVRSRQSLTLAPPWSVKPTPQVGPLNAALSCSTLGSRIPPIVSPGTCTSPLVVPLV